MINFRVLGADKRSMKKPIKTLQILCALVIAVLLVNSTKAYAQQTCSGQYCSNEYYFGTGGNNDLNSAHYNANTGTGALGVGNTASAQYRAEGGYLNANEEYLEFFVSSSPVNLGVLSNLSASTATASFTVRNYLSSGYAVLSYGTPLTSGTHTFTNLASPTTSSPGSEQFGINLIDNSSPNIGTNPVLVPDSTFSFGTAASGYGTLNNFKYVSSDPVATSTQSTGETDYTISYLANISTLTPGGVYTMSHILVVVPTF